ncbi:MAG: glycosyltransferase family 4 protein [Plesiomonas sp.]|uniref:glycosyltransferase family 4 protein n=1 Tax=Plesiomonas sp. TaxID=2486279 RepID=UPI003F2DAD98
MTKCILLLDPIAFNGGSKIANRYFLGLLPEESVKITVLTRNAGAWKTTGWRTVNLYELPFVRTAESGIPYFLRHLFFALQVLLLRIRLGMGSLLVGGSGPGVDLALYLSKLIVSAQIIQLVHGPVACSRTCGRCLKMADRVLYLASCQESLKAALRATGETDEKINQRLHSDTWSIMQNGIPRSRWPSAMIPINANTKERPVRIFWAASLLKWKGLDLLLHVLQQAAIDTPNTVAWETEICFLRPKDITLPVTQISQTISNVHWHEEPDNLDQIRSACTVFISTSKNEPFGLSILEALCVGLCVIIPADGAYWDQKLEHGINCLKYQPDSSETLLQCLTLLQQQPALIRQLGEAGEKVAATFRAEIVYQQPLEVIKKLIC